jgi:hypothetical protein
MSDKNLCWADLDYWPGTYEEGGNKTYQCDDLVQDCSLGLCPEHCASIHEEKVRHEEAQLARALRKLLDEGYSMTDLGREPRDHAAGHPPSTHRAER